MVIYYARPNTIASEIEVIHGKIIGELGKKFINELYTIIENLKKHWKGSDAEKNLKELVEVYYNVVVYMKKTEALIVDINDKEIIPLQKHISLIGGVSGQINNLSNSIIADPNINIPEGETQSFTDVQIVNDISNLNRCVKMLETFVKTLETQKDIVLRNWTDGGSYREKVVRTFTNFEENFNEQLSNLKTTNENLNNIVNIKKQLL